MADDTSPERTPRALRTELRIFLIADVRGYTRFTHEHGDEAASALAIWFAGVVRAVAPPFGGELLELRGDEALCVFGSARQALRAAVELQRRLRTQDAEGELFPLGVGVGVDAGEAVPAEGGYRGGALNLAARLCSLAKPGQILASDGVAHMAQHVDGIRLGPRRPVKLKGLGTPVRLVEVVPEAPLPPLPAAPSRPFLAHRVAWVVVAAVLVVATLAAAALTRDSVRQASPRVVVRPGSIAVLDEKTGRVVGDIPLGLNGQPAPVAPGDGFVWAMNPDTQTVFQIDPGTLRAVPIGLGVSPSDVTFTPGQVWIASPDPASVTDLSATSPLVHHTIRVADDHRGFESRVAVGHGFIWVAPANGLPLARIDAVTGKLVRTRPIAAEDVAAAGDQVWVRQGDQPTRITELAPQRHSALIPTPEAGTPANSTWDLAAGYGFAWYATGQLVWKVASAPVATADTIPLPSSAQQITTGAGSVWVTDATGTVLRIDPASDKITHRFPVHSGLFGIAVAGGRLWVGVGAG